jgi:ribosomal protein RSM22 (predicted rRNA methylase)
MNILNGLSSQIGDRTEAANKRVAAQVLREPMLLEQIASGLMSPDRKLAGDCAEVMTNVAAEKPELIVPYSNSLIAQIAHEDTRVRWESMHTLAEIASKTPENISTIVHKLVEMIAIDKSVIVRDYAIKTLGKYGGTSTQAARQVWPHLRKALTLWEGKHAGKALEAMYNVVSADPSLKADARRIAKQFNDHRSAKARTMARRLLK